MHGGIRPREMPGVKPGVSLFRTHNPLVVGFESYRAHVEYLRTRSEIVRRKRPRARERASQEALLTFLTDAS
jgi:hypothetical protein